MRSSLFLLSRQTFKDLLKERILYNVFFISILLLFFGYLAALLVFGHQDRVMLHFGVFVNSVSVFFVAASAGSRFVRNEIESRNLYLILGRPLSRVTYFWSRWIGISIFAFLNLILLFLVLGAAIHLMGGALKLPYFQAISLIWVEATVLAALALASSLFLRPGLTMMGVFAFFFVSHNHQQLTFLKDQGKEMRPWLQVMESLTPDAQLFMMDTRVYYEQALSMQEWLTRMGYGLLWMAIFMMIGNALFYRKNI